MMMKKIFSTTNKTFYTLGSNNIRIWKCKRENSNFQAWSLLGFEAFVRIFFFFVSLWKVEHRRNSCFQIILDYSADRKMQMNRRRSSSLVFHPAFSTSCSFRTRKNRFQDHKWRVKSSNTAATEVYLGQEKTFLICSLDWKFIVWSFFWLINSMLEDRLWGGKSGCISGDIQLVTSSSLLFILIVLGTMFQNSRELDVIE